MSEHTLAGVVQDEIAARLAARPRFSQKKPTPCGVGWPKNGPQRPEHVWLDGDVDDWVVTPASTGAAGIYPQDEEFDLRVNFLATLNVPTYSEVRDHALELAGELETLLRVDPFLGGLVQSIEITGGQITEGVIDKGRQCLIERVVHVRTYLGVTTEDLGG